MINYSKFGYEISFTENSIGLFKAFKGMTIKEGQNNTFSVIVTENKEGIEKLRQFIHDLPDTN